MVRGLRTRDRGVLARAITLIESTREPDRAAAQKMLELLLPDTGKAIRVGITGVPGAGKSTFIDALGMRLVETGKRVAVLAVDPSSETTGGSILGDKTRMDRLSRDQRAYIRPSPAANAAGGVAPRTRETMLLCEAAGFDVVLVETVGTGQSELAVAHMVDTFVLLTLAGAGDELQGIKRGVMELADVIVVHKIDSTDSADVERTRTDLATAQRLLRQGHDSWTAPILGCSSVSGAGLEQVWRAIEEHGAALGEEGVAEKRRQQALHWFDACVLDQLQRDFLSASAVMAALPELRRRVLAGALPPADAAAELLRQHRR